MDSRPSPRMTKEQLRRQRIKSTAFSTIQGYIASIFWQCTSHDSATRRQIAHPERVNVISGETAGSIAAAPKEQPPRKLSGKRTAITGKL